jgi:hypothetical protein
MNEFETSKKFIKGKSIEKEFADILIREGYKVEEATKEEDMKLHVDLWATTKEGKKYGIDVKGIKFGNEDRIILELKNPNGFTGWLFGEQTFIAFETEEYFLLVQRDKLCVLMAKLLIDEIFEVQSNDRMPLYKKLTFPFNKSVLVKLKVLDIFPIITKIFYKINLIKNF